MIRERIAEAAPLRSWLGRRECGCRTRNGYALRATQIKRADRIDRLLLILALAYILLVGLGRLARRRYRPGMWCRTKRPKECSDFTIGRVLLSSLHTSAAVAFAAVRLATEQVAPNWG